MRQAVLAACLCLGVAHGQAVPPAQVLAIQAPANVSDLPPSAVLAETLAPLERTRADMANWSEVELAAFEQTSSAAKAACLRIEQTPHEGEEALALARLCALGLDWDGTYSAARWYTRASAPAGEALHLPLGFSLLIQADLNLQAVSRCLEDLAELQKRLPLTGETDSIFRYAIQALEITRPESGLAIASMRQPLLLEMLRKAPDAGLVSPGLLEAEAWQTLSMLHLQGRSDDEQRGKAELMEAISARTAQLSPADGFLAGQGRARYEWLGRTLPNFARSGDTYARGKAHTLPASVRLLIVEQENAADVPALAAGVDGLRSRLGSGAEALLVLQKAAAGTHSTAPRPSPVHAIFTGDSLLGSLSFPGGPVFVLLDGRQRIVFLGEGSTAWLNPHMQAETLMQRAASMGTPARSGAR